MKPDTPSSATTASIRETDPSSYKEGASTPELLCPECDMPQSEWQFNGNGFERYGQTFCCQGCAEGTGCTCG